MMNKEIEFKAGEFDIKQMSELVKILKAKGLDVSCEYSSTYKTAQLTFSNLPTEYEVQRAKGGRRPNHITVPSKSQFRSETTCKEFLDWLEDGHTHDEAIAELGLSRATYFRKLRKIKEAVAWEEKHKAGRKAAGYKLHPSTLGSI